MLSPKYVIPQDINIPQELQDLGFAKYTLVDYQKDGDAEYFTFSDWRTKQSGDTITFVVKCGEIKKLLKEESQSGNIVSL